MSRTIIVLIVLLSVALAGLLIYSNLKSKHAPPPLAAVAPSNAQPAPLTPAPKPPMVRSTPTVTPTTPVTTPPRSAVPATNRAPGAGIRTIVTDNSADDDDAPLKPLPVLERDYTTTTNRDTRLDIMMDIAETPGPEAVRSLTRLFEMETDPEMKVDLLDSLLGIDGFKEEKLVMLSLGLRQGLPADVRQSAIDGLIDLEDTRVISLLNGLLNDPDPEIRESAQDALEIVQNPLETPKPK